MKILVMEDQEEKYKQIENVIKMGNSLKWEKNCQLGLMELRQNKYELLLLDMSMPISDEEKIKDNFDSYAGMSVLREIKRRKYDLKVVVITGFNDFEKGNELITLSELDKKIKENYNNIYLGYVKYDSTSVEWQDKLQQMLLCV